MLSVGDGFNMPARVDRLRVFTGLSLHLLPGSESVQKVGKVGIDRPDCRVSKVTPRLERIDILHRVATAAASARRTPALFLLAGVLLLAFLIHVGWGGNWLSPLDVLRELVHGITTGDRSNTVVWELRLPRAIACVLVGGMLAAVGSSFQSLFRNPLADPFIVGVSSGAAVGGVCALVLGISAAFGGLGTMALAFVGGIGSLLLVLTLAHRRGIIDVTTLLLSGVVVGSFLSGVISLALYATGENSRVMQWLMGSMTPMFWSRVVILAVAAAIGPPILMLQSRKMNAFAIGESTARHLGINTSQLKATILITGTAMAAVCVGAVGIIGFLGLVAPHIARRILGVDWRVSMPGALLIGPTLLLTADVIAQRLIPGMELPVGVITALLGAPFLLILLRKDAKA